MSGRFSSESVDAMDRNTHLLVVHFYLDGGNIGCPASPCAKTGECTDCRSIDRICNVFTIIEGKPFRTQLTVVIVDEDLGLSWDTSWPQSPVSGIIEEYKRFVWIPPRDDC